MIKLISDMLIIQNHQRQTTAFKPMPIRSNEHIESQFSGSPKQRHVGYGECNGEAISQNGNMMH